MSVEPEAIKDRVLRKLRDDGLVRRGAEILVEHAFSQPFSDLISSEELVDWVFGGLEQPWPQKETEDVLRSLQMKFGETDLRVSSGVPAIVRGDIERLLSEAPPPPDWVGSVVDGARVKLLVEPVIQSTLLRFAKKLPGAGLAGAGLASGGVADKLRKRVQKSAGKVRELGRIAAQGLSAEMDRRVGEFSKGVADSFRDEMQERLNSEEGKRLASEIRIEAFRRSLELPLSSFVEEGLKADAEWWQVAQRGVLELDSPSLRAEVAELVQSSIGSRSLNDHCGSHSEETKRVLVDRLTHVAKPLIESSEFQAWLGELLA